MNNPICIKGIDFIIKRENSESCWMMWARLNEASLLEPWNSRAENSVSYGDTGQEVSERKILAVELQTILVLGKECDCSLPLYCEFAYSWIEIRGGDLKIT